jgi:hypothetical protein
MFADDNLTGSSTLTRIPGWITNSAVDDAASPMYWRSNEADADCIQDRAQPLLAEDIDGDDRTARNVQPAPPRRQSARLGDEPHRHRRLVFDVAGRLERRWVR